MENISKRSNSKVRYVKSKRRIYPRAILERELENYQKFIRENRALGECDHPDTSVVELKNVSHIIRDAHMQGDVVYGTIELLDTPSGKILKKPCWIRCNFRCILEGRRIYKKAGDTDVVQEDFQLICFDMVSEPSTPGAFMMSEGKTVSRRELDNTFTKTDKIDRIFNEILGWDK